MDFGIDIGVGVEGFTVNILVYYREYGGGIPLLNSLKTVSLIKHVMN